MPCRNWLKPEGCSVPGPQSPSLLMNPRFLGSDTDVALRKREWDGYACEFLYDDVNDT